MSELVRIATASVLAGIATAALLASVFPPTARLSARLRPYATVSRTMLGKTTDPRVTLHRTLGGSSIGRLLGPPLTALAETVGAFLEVTSEEQLALKIRQAGLFRSTRESLRVQEYRIRQLVTAVAGSAGAGALGWLLSRSTLMVLVLATVGFAGGAALWRSRIDRAIETRTARMEIELYTINQQLALRVRIGGGVNTAVRQVVERGRGAVVDELAEALRLMQGGMPSSEAFGRMSAATPEPHAARMYQLLASSEERGSDLAAALLTMSEDIREDRRDAMRTRATRRRAAMLVPIVGLMAPIMILFVGAPLPWIVFRGLG